MRRPADDYSPSSSFEGLGRCLLVNICIVDNSLVSSGVDIVEAFVRNKSVKRALEVVGSIGEMLVESVCMGRRRDHGDVIGMLGVIHQGLIL